MDEKNISLDLTVEVEDINLEDVEDLTGPREVQVQHSQHVVVIIS